MADIETIVGGMALDLIGKLTEGLKEEGADLTTFEVVGAMLYIAGQTTEDGGQVGWRFMVTDPDTVVARRGLTDLASEWVRE